MSFPPLPTTTDNLDGRRWETYQPYYEELQSRTVTPETAQQWLQDWSKLERVFNETSALIYIAKSQDTTDSEKEQAFIDLVSNVFPKMSVAQQALKQTFLDLALTDDELTLVRRQMKNEFDLFREENIALETELQLLGSQYDNLTGALKADWAGEEQNLSQLSAHLENKDNATRERAWQTMMDLWKSVRTDLDALYTKMLPLRVQAAHNAGFENFRDFAFRQHGRFEYTPEDCFTFHNAIEEVVVPSAQRILEKKRKRLGLETLRPWDTLVETSDEAPLAPYNGQEELVTQSLNIFNQIDTELGRYFAIMAEEDLLDLETRQGKALGGYCSYLNLRKRPFIFMNGVGTHDNVQTLLHEAGHAFHAFEAAKLPLHWQENAPMEFCEVASMAMELLAGPFLTHEHKGFYTPAEAARARIAHLESQIIFLPYMAVVDSFQHWVYTHPDEASDAANCDAQWDALWQRFMLGTDWRGFEEERKSGWHRKLHIFHVPFYYIEYGMASIGAMQVWRNSLQDPAKALADYRYALSLGGTKTLPELFEAAGAEFRFDVSMLTELITLAEETIAELEQHI